MRRARSLSGAEARPDLARRALLERGAQSAACALLGAPLIARSQAPLNLDFLTIPDPDGWHSSLRLKGDWLVVAISDGVLTGYGEASHSTDDQRCRRIAAEIFARRYRDFTPTLQSLAADEAELAGQSPDFVTATALSGINQAFYDLLAKREQVPVWQLFRARPGLQSIPLYATINRALQNRSAAEYRQTAAALAALGFATFKCAPFEAVATPADGLRNAGPGLALLAMLRELHPALGIRVDFHERFLPEHFFELLGEFERLELDWLEEPFEMGPNYTKLKALTRLRVAAGELFWGRDRFDAIATARWADVIMPDVKHVGGFGPLLGVIEMAAGRIEVSPHNPSGPISTAASLHAAAVHPETVATLEYAFDRAGGRRATGEVVERGSLLLTDRPGWGVAPV